MLIKLQNRSFLFCFCLNAINNIILEIVLEKMIYLKYSENLRRFYYGYKQPQWNSYLTEICSKNSWIIYNIIQLSQHFYDLSIVYVINEIDSKDIFIDLFIFVLYILSLTFWLWCQHYKISILTLIII